MTTYFEPIPYPLWSADKSAFADAIGSSFRETGFAVISDHGLDESMVDRAIAASKAFFALPEEVKRNYYKDEWGGQRGYSPFGQENAKGAIQADLKEFWHTGREGKPGTAGDSIMLPTPHVKELEDFDTATQALYDALDEMGRNILAGIALHLGLEEDWFDAKVKEGNSILRLLHYPPHNTPPPEGSVRAAAHGDINTITLLLGAEEAGLQALHRSGEWLSVSPPAGSLVVNCGDMLSRLTNGVLPSTIHRVLNPSAERSKFPRYSTPFFLHFAPDVLIETLPDCVGDQETAPPPINAQDFLMERLREIGLVRT